MNRKSLFVRNYNWRILLMRVVVNMLALLITLLIVPQINLVTRSILAWLWLALALGVLNALVKPIIQVLTLRFIFATGGLVVILINAIMLILLSWLFPRQISVDGIGWALVGGAVLGITAAFLESLLGLSPPIVSDKYPEIRQRIQDRQFYKTQAELARIEARKTGGARELATAKVLVTSARASVKQYVAPAPPPASDADLELGDDEDAADHVAPLTSTAAPEV